jgi:hypothetical protein
MIRAIPHELVALSKVIVSGASTTCWPQPIDLWITTPI